MLTLTTGVVAFMFFFTYLPQLAVLVVVNGPLAVFTTVLVVLNESSAIVSMISRKLVLQEALLDTFDGVLVAKDATNLVSEGRQLKPGSNPMGMLASLGLIRPCRPFLEASQSLFEFGSHTTQYRTSREIELT